MTVHLVTGHAGKIHVTSAEQGKFYAHMYGEDVYIANGCECSIVDNYTVHIEEGLMLLNGRHVQVNNGGDDVAIGMGTVGMKRRDLVCAKYEMNIVSGVESVSLVVVEGEAGDSYVAPEIAPQSILDGDNPCIMPLYSVDVDELLNLHNVQQVCETFDTYASIMPHVRETLAEADADMTAQIDAAEQRFTGLSETISEELADAKAEVEQRIADRGLNQNAIRVTLTPEGWDAETLTKVVGIPQVRANYGLIVSPDPGYIEAYSDATITAVEQGDGTLTFKCESIPEANVVAVVIVLDAIVNSEVVG